MYGKQTVKQMDVAAKPFEDINTSFSVFAQSEIARLINNNDSRLQISQSDAFQAAQELSDIRAQQNAFYKEQVRAMVARQQAKIEDNPQEAGKINGELETYTSYIYELAKRQDEVGRMYFKEILAGKDNISAMEAVNSNLQSK